MYPNSELVLLDEVEKRLKCNPQFKSWFDIELSGVPRGVLYRDAIGSASAKPYTTQAAENPAVAWHDAITCKEAAKGCFMCPLFQSFELGSAWLFKHILHFYLKD
ncbi:BEL1-like homeodomain 7 [Perilla frutescens var. frutescens]|nr:BEL1-like homeodomain 7 [Perilla frutescens var. frutescens]